MAAPGSVPQVVPTVVWAVAMAMVLAVAVAMVSGVALARPRVPRGLPHVATDTVAAWLPFNLPSQMSLLGSVLLPSSVKWVATFSLML
jgi:hypothetical protein